jgi:hypothetical protein
MAIQYSYSTTPGSQITLPVSDLPSYAQSGTVTLNNGTVYPTAYGQVTSTSVTKTGGTAHLIVYSDSSKVSSVEAKFIEFSYDINGDNPIKQAYQHLKTLPEFSDATDC